jgi:Tol biopolymer transport system component
MQPDDRFTLTVSDWLETEGRGPAPEWLHEAAMASVVRVRQRPAWAARVGGWWAGGPPEIAERRQRAIRVVLVLAGLILALIAVATIAARRTEPTPIRDGSILVARDEGTSKTRYLTMEPDGTGEREVFEANECGQCAFLSPDGTRIMIPEVSGERLTTAIIRADGSAKVVLLPFPDTTVNLGPGGWSADGSHIALSGWDDTNAARRGIYVARPDGTDLRQVTRSEDGRVHDWPTFSPDGTKLVFIAQDAVGAPGGGFDGDLFVVDIDGSGLRQLNSAGTKVHETVTNGRPMDWSPDGTRIVFAVIDGPISEGRSASFVVPAAGGDPVRRSDWVTWDVSVEWSPTGEWILSGGAGPGNESIRIARPDGSAERVLWPVDATDPACCGTWSPGGDRILFQRGPIGTRDLWTMDATGGTLEQLTHVPAAYVWYGWAARP